MLLGATGSIGRSTVDLLERDPEGLRVAAVAGGRDHEALARVARAVGGRSSPPSPTRTRYAALKEALSGHAGSRSAPGAQAVIEAAEREADLVVSAIVGAAGVEPTHAALRARPRRRARQ